MTKVLVMSLKGEESDLKDILEENEDRVLEYEFMEYLEKNYWSKDEIITKRSISKMINKKSKGELTEKDKKLLKDYLKRKAKRPFRLKIHVIQKAHERIVKSFKYYTQQLLEAARIILGDDVPEEWKKMEEILYELKRERTKGV